MVLYACTYLCSFVHNFVVTKNFVYERGQQLCHQTSKDAIIIMTMGIVARMIFRYRYISIR